MNAPGFLAQTPCNIAGSGSVETARIGGTVEQAQIPVLFELVVVINPRNDSAPAAVRRKAATPSAGPVSSRSWRSQSGWESARMSGGSGSERSAGGGALVEVGAVLIGR
jgi:hypothetical protein